MKKYLIEINEGLNVMLEESAKVNNTTVEKTILQILNRYTVSPHILNNEEAKKAYEECGEINLEIANL